MTQTELDLDLANDTFERRGAWLASYAALASLIAVVMLILFYAQPGIRDHLFAEDKFLEWSTVAMYGAAIVVAAVGVFFAGSAKARWISVLFILLGLVFALEETSYGQRIFGFDELRILGVKFDGLHDLMFITAKAFKTLAEVYGKVWFALPAILGVVALFLILRFRGPILAFAVPLLKETPFLFIFLTIALGVIALTVDFFGFMQIEVLQCLEEILEFSAALALVFGALSAWRC